MPRSRRRDPSTRDEQPAACVVRVCRGGDCGSKAKHPGTDHRAQLAQITDQLAQHAKVMVTKCLDACEHSNVIVVTPNPAHTDDADPVWLGQMNDATATADLIDWVRCGGPDRAEMPVGVELASFSPSRRMRHALED